jgi:hypothetical protein
VQRGDLGRVDAAPLDAAPSSTGRMDSPMAAISSSSAATMLVSIPKR